MRILCRLLGHKLEKGYHGSPPYLTKQIMQMDGIGRIHVGLYGKCARCGEGMHVANIHLPELADYPERMRRKFLDPHSTH